jgi:hypothetical protein
MSQGDTFAVPVRFMLARRKIGRKCPIIVLALMNRVMKLRNDMWVRIFFWLRRRLW